MPRNKKAAIKVIAALGVAADLMKIDSARLQREIIRGYTGRYPKHKWDRRSRAFKNSPMQCKHPDCAKLRKTDPAFVQELQDAGINAHYIGKCRGPFSIEFHDQWMLDGITPVGRDTLQAMIDEHRGPVPKKEVGLKEALEAKVFPMTTDDPRFPMGTEAAVCELIRQRQIHGFKKYGKTVQDNPLTLKQWLQHALEESLDMAIYLKRAIEELDKKPTPPKSRGIRKRTTANRYGS